jgi:hypothetical protein
MSTARVPGESNGERREVLLHDAIPMANRGQRRRESRPSRRRKIGDERTSRVILMRRTAAKDRIPWFGKV